MTKSKLPPAPGAPGMEPKWTSSAKSGVGTAFNSISHVWFTLSHGIFDEIFYPRLDIACTRDLGLIVTDGHDFFSDEKRDTHHEVKYIAEGVPAYLLVNTCKQGRYRIEKKIIADPERDVVLQRTRFVPLKGSLGDYHLYALLAPHLGNQGASNNAWLHDFKGVPMLFAEREGLALALAATNGWLNRSVGYVGASDGWQDLIQHRQMTWHYGNAENGNVALTGEIDLRTSQGEFTIALGLGAQSTGAGHQVRASLENQFEDILEQYVNEWTSWQRSLLHLGLPQGKNNDRDKISTAVLHTHSAKEFTGGIIASLSIPWGESKGDHDLGGYHLVWARDMIEAVGGLQAAGAQNDALRVIHYLQVTQEEDGHWPQNMWLDGTAYWQGIQMDETGLPILLTESGWRSGLIKTEEMARLWPMVRLAAGYLVRHGPATNQDRWEETPGYSPFTLAVEIAALLAAADLAEIVGEPEVTAYLRETADLWNDNIEYWTYVDNTRVAKQVGVKGYYVRIAPPKQNGFGSDLEGKIMIKNLPAGQNVFPVAEIVSPDALALVRFGLRAPDDVRILNTIKVVDALTRVETPYGPAWHRYNHDGYGEHQDGSPYDGTGIGRAWPLLTGERAHYEIAAGHREAALNLLHTLDQFANKGGMIPEQIWDAPDVPERALYCGQPTGSAMPLVWAHAEYIKLRRSLHAQQVFDMPPQPVQRYIRRHIQSPFAMWRFDYQASRMPAGKMLRLELWAPACVHWSADGWKTTHDQETRDTELGIYLADLPTAATSPGKQIDFTFYWPQAGHWEERNYSVLVQ